MNIQIEVTSHCNLKCVECPHRLMQRDRDHIALPVFDMIVDKLIKTHKPGTVIVHKDGEPLLHPNFEQIIGKIAMATSAKVDIYTNGKLLSKDLIGFLGSFKNKFSLLVSFHLYNYDGKRNDYEEIGKKLLECLDVGATNIEFILATHSTDLTSEEELKEWKEYWDEKAKLYSRLTGVHVNTAINPWTGLIKQKNTITFPACPYSDGQHLFVGVTGNILPCCMDLEEEIIFGNVEEDDLHKIMIERDQFYKSLRDGKIERDLCRRCLNQ
jgi:radical SAM protein with 4Fe4S-binding SPASM domain